MDGWIAAYEESYFDIWYVCCIFFELLLQPSRCISLKTTKVPRYLPMEYQCRRLPCWLLANLFKGFSIDTELKLSGITKGEASIMESRIPAYDT